MSRTLEIYRFAVVMLAISAAAVNAGLVIAMIRNHRDLGHGWATIGYPLVASATLCVSAYFRLADGWLSPRPLTIGDFTALIPTLGFFIVGILGWRWLGRAVGVKDAERAGMSTELLYLHPHHRRRTA